MGNATRRLGMRRISWIRLVVDADGTRAEVHGVRHRLPRSVPVPVKTVAALVAEGVPLIVQRRRSRALDA